MLFDYNIDAQGHHPLFNHFLNSIAGADKTGAKETPAKA